MSGKTLGGMVEHGIWKNAPFTYDYLSDSLKEKFFEDMRAAILWLADNVSDEMVRAACEDRAKDDEQTFAPLAGLIDFSGENKTRTVVRSAISAALRAAAGNGR